MSTDLIPFFTMFFLIQYSWASAPSESSFPLDEMKNGIHGSVEIVKSKTPKTTKVRILDEHKKEVESTEVPGHSPKLERIMDTSEDGPFFLITTDQHAEFGSYSGLMTRPFQVKKAHLEWAKISKGPEADRQIILMQSLKNTWKMSALDIYEISCRPDFEKITEDESKFKVTYTHYHFAGGKWESREKSTEGCWETGDKFPARSFFP